ncbi:MAG: hypothetical protein ACK5QH_04950 [Rubrivivax sp.]|jgi:hypothetical protein
MRLRHLFNPLLPAALVLPVFLACAQSPSSGSCDYQPVSLAADGAVFSGRVGEVQIRLHTERTDQLVDSFPDSSLHISSARGARCQAEGGVWHRRGVWVASDGRTVAAIESSGSGAVLVFFSVEDCQRVGQIDVSGSRWRIVGRHVETTPALGAERTPRRRQLGTDCRP